MCIFQMKLGFIYRAILTPKTFAFGLWKIRMNIELHRCLLKRLVCGMPWANFKLSDHFFFFFAAMVTAECYQEFIFNFVLQLNTSEWHVQQDGVHTHSGQTTMTLLNEFFIDHLISEGRWPTRTPDLTPLDFFVVFLKNWVCLTEPAEIEELNTWITQEIHSIDVPTLHREFRNLINPDKTKIFSEGPLSCLTKYDCCKLQKYDTRVCYVKIEERRNWMTYLLLSTNGFVSWQFYIQNYTILWCKNSLMLLLAGE